MKPKKNPITENIENYFREVFELQQAKIWAASGSFFAVTGGYQAMSSLITGSVIPDTLLLSVGGMTIGGLMAMKRFSQAWPVISKQAKLTSGHLEIEPLDATRKKAAKLKDNRALLGTGFNWGPEHATNMYTVSAMPSSRRDVQVPRYLRKVIKFNPELREILGGESYLMALGNEGPVSVHPDTWRAHTLILGLPGTGKTTLLKLIALNKLWSEKPTLLIIIDPKNTPEMRDGLRAEMKRQGKEDQFYYFSPARPSESVVVDCLANYNRTVEIATRVVECIPTGGSAGEVFKAFCWERVNQVAQATEFIGERLTLRRLQYYLREGMERLVEAALREYYRREFSDDWDKLLDAKIKATGGSTYVECLMAYYIDVLAKDKPNSAVSGVIEQFRKPASEVLGKTASLNSILEQLCSAPLDDLLSPDMEKLAENSPRVVNLRELSNTGGVLYMATDGLTDPVIAGTISKLVSAATAAASAERYNFGTGKEIPVCFMIDEAHNALNDPILNLLAVGRQSQYELFLATQSMPDIVEKTSDATAERVKALCANTIALRCEDTMTREFVSEKIGMADLTTFIKMRSNASASDSALHSYQVGSGTREQTQERALFPPYIVSSLPNLQAICSFSNGNKTLLRLPVEPRK